MAAQAEEGAFLKQQQPQQSPDEKPRLKMKWLGHTGVQVSELCMGAMTLQLGDGSNAWGMPGASEEVSYQLLDRFKERGGNFIDTSNNYSSSEEVVGRWLSTQRRGDFVIATKVRGVVGPGPNDQGLSRKHILQAAQDSLTKLQTDYIDLYQLHKYDSGTPLKETFSALNDLVRVGKVHYIGLSNFTGWQIQKAVDLCNHMGLAPVVSVQPQYSLLCRSTEYEILPVCQQETLAVLPWSPLTGGWLSGKYRRGAGGAADKKPTMEAGSRVEWAQKVGWKETNWDSLDNEHTWRVLDTVWEIAEARNKTPAQVSLRWLMQKPGVTAPIIGARTLKNLDDNLDAAGWSLTEEEMEKLDAVSQHELPYPYNRFWSMDRNRSDI